MTNKFIHGKGFLATALNRLNKNKKFDNYFFYALGISNSKIKLKNELNREKKEIKSFLKTYSSPKILVYISSISIFDVSMRDTPYVKNKIFIENLLKSKVKKLLILRLPQIAGRSKNKNTILNYIYNKVQNKETLEIWKNVERSIIDVEDLLRILKIVLKKNLYINLNEINIINPNLIKILDIVKIFENLMGIKFKARYNLITLKNYNRSFYNSLIKNNIYQKEINKICKKKNYVKRIIFKYYK